MTQKHTEGKFRVSYRESDGQYFVTLIGQRNGFIDPVIAEILGDFCTDAEAKANAELFAQAPTLLAERNRLREINSFLRQDKRELVGLLKKTLSGAGENIMSQKLCPLHGADCDDSCELKAAIAKAEKEQEP